MSSNWGQATLTVLIPTKNRPSYLATTLASIPHQCVTIIIDDGSSLEQSQINRRLADRFNCFYHRNRKSRGASAARNQAAKLASTPWLLFLDDDDELVASSFEGLENLIKNSSLAVSAWVPDVVSGPSREKSLVDQSLMKKRNRIGGCSGVVIRKDYFDSVSGFDERLASMQDWDLWVRLCTVSEVWFSGLTCVSYNQNSPDKITHDLKAKYRGLRRLFIKHSNLWSSSDRVYHLLRLAALRILLGNRFQVNRLICWHPIVLFYILRWRRYRSLMKS